MSEIVSIYLSLQLCARDDILVLGETELTTSSIRDGDIVVSPLVVNRSGGLVVRESDSDTVDRWFDFPIGSYLRFKVDNLRAFSNGALY